MSEPRDRSSEVVAAHEAGAGRVGPLTVSGEVVAGVLLVDLPTMSVVHADQGGLAMLPHRHLPVPLDRWGEEAGLVGVDGQPLTGADAMSAVALGGGRRGVMVQRRAERAPGSDRAQSTQVLWLTGFPLTASTREASPDGTPVDRSRPEALRERALLVLLEVSAAGLAGRGDGTADMHNRAVIATDLSFTISDPNAEDDPLVWVNPAFERTTGYSAEQVLGRNCRFLQGPDTDPEALDRIRAALRAAEPIRETLLNYRADGSAFWNQVSISPVLDADGALVNFVGIQADVTVRVDGEHAREQALASERRARSRLLMLADIGDALTGMDPGPALQRLCEVLVRGLATWCVAFEVDDEVRLVASSGASIPRHGRFRLSGHQVDGYDPLADLAAGRTRDTFEVGAEDADHEPGTLTRWVVDQLRDEEAPAPWVALSAPGRRDVTGLILMGVPALPLDNEERDLLRQVGRRTGLSLDNARLYAREHLVAETLQRSMLPEVVDVPGLDIWSFYAPGVQHAQIGGDWYDVLRIQDGTVGLVIGDVVGHDIEAASAMGQLRSVVRAYSADGDDPAAVLMRVDQLVGGMRITRSASLVYATLRDQGEGYWEMTWARAGHLPPILVHDGRATALMDAGGPMVGLVAGPRESADLSLSPGDVLVLYTDGLIERRARPMKTGLDRLVGICGDLGVSDAAGIGERLLIELGDEPEDDIALVVLRVPVPGEAPLTGGTTHSRRWQLPGEASSIPRARALTTQMCDLWRLPQSRQAELVVSELVANAVLHGHGTVSLHVREAPDRGLRIEVGDANPTPPRRVDGHPDRTGGFGLTVVGTVAQWGWRAESMGKVVWALVPAVEV